MAGRKKFETVEIRTHRELALFYFAVLLGLGAFVIALGREAYWEILGLDAYRDILEDLHLLWSAVLVLCGTLIWLYLFPGVALDLLTGRPIATLSRDGVRARAGGLFAGFTTVAWQDITEIDAARPPTRSPRFAPFLVFRIEVRFKSAARGSGVVVGGHRRKTQKARSGRLIIPTSYAQLNARDIENLLNQFLQEFGEPNEADDGPSTESSQPFTSLSDGIQFPLHTPVEETLRPDPDQSHGKN